MNLAWLIYCFKLSKNAIHHGKRVGVVLKVMILAFFVAQYPDGFGYFHCQNLVNQSQKARHCLSLKIAVLAEGKLSNFTICI
jgi:hypothetical protein